MVAEVWMTPFRDQADRLQPKDDLFLTAEPAKTATFLLAIPFLLRLICTLICINPIDSSLREEIMRLAGETIIANRWV
jgi:hypothetical protein